MPKVKAENEAREKVNIKARIRTKYEGVYYRERVALFNGKPDRSYDVCRTVNGRKQWTFGGRASLGITPEIARDARLQAMIKDLSAVKDPELGKLLDLYERDTPLRYSAESARLRLNACRKWLRQLEALRVSELSRERLATWLDNLSGTLGVVSRKKLLVALRRALALGAEAGLWSGPNPTEGVKVRGEEVVCERFLTRKDADSLLEILSTVSPEWRDMVELSLKTGLRALEILGLTSRDVNPATLTIHLTGKSGRRETVPILPETLEALRPRLSKPGLLFSRPPYRLFYKAVRLSGLNEGITEKRHKVRFHSMRHSYASWLVQSGVDLYLVQRLLRHSSPAMTQRYAHLRPGDLRSVLSHLNFRS